MSEYDLEKSYHKIGAIYPILVDRNGNVVDGFHRRQVDEKWPVQVLDWVKTREDQLVARIVANTCRRTVSMEERKRELTELATIMANRGVPIGKIAEEIAEKTGLSESYIRKILPRHLKLEPRVKAGEARWEEISKEKASFGERGKSLHDSGVQILPTLQPMAGTPPPQPDLGRVEVLAREMFEPSRLLEEHYPQVFLAWATMRVGEAVRDPDLLTDTTFLRRACRELLDVAWTRLSASPLVEDVRREFYERVRALEAERRGSGEKDN